MKKQPPVQPRQQTWYVTVNRYGHIREGSRGKPVLFRSAAEANNSKRVPSTERIFEVTILPLNEVARESSTPQAAVDAFDRAFKGGE